MQLTGRPPGRSTARGVAASTLLLVVLACHIAGDAGAQGSVDVTGTVYHDSGGGLEMTVVNPGVNISGTIKDSVTIRAAYEADIVTGASVAVVDAPGSTVDAITSATQLDDIRHVAGGGFTLHGEFAELTVGYTYGGESDYRSHGFSLSARSELFERNTAIQLSYGRGWDESCNLSQPGAQDAVDRQRLPSSDGCFSADDRVSSELSIQTFQGSWTQAWAPVLVTQLSVSGQVLNGYQGNPYRGVWLGRSAAQENHPDNRGRYAVGLGVRAFIRPTRGAIHLNGRIYRDTWDLSSVTAEFAYEQTITEGLRLRARGRYYNQTRAAFYSDDYVLFPRGQYFTGDRELSPMSSWTIGGRLVWSVSPNDEGYVAGFLDSLDLVLKFDYLLFDFREFNYGDVGVPNDQALMATLAIQAEF